MRRVYGFRIPGPENLDLQSGESLPIYDEYGSLIGAFCLNDFNQISGFIAGQGHPLTIELSEGRKLYLTLEEKPRGVSSAALTLKPLGVNSLAVNDTFEVFHGQKEDNIE
jgi:hypothetical protein